MGWPRSWPTFLRPLVGYSAHHIRNTETFVDQVRTIRIVQWECITSYNVKVLFTSIPVDPAISIIKHKLQQDIKLHRAFISIHHIITLLEFCLKNTQFLSHGKYYDQVPSAAMCSPIICIVVNLFMDEFATKAITLPQAPKFKAEVCE